MSEPNTEERIQEVANLLGELLDVSEGATRFVGTPAEVTAAVVQWYQSLKNFVIGYTSVQSGDKLVPGPHADECLDEMERGVWELTIRPHGTTTDKRVRNSLVVTVGNLDNMMELYELVGKGTVDASET